MSSSEQRKAHHHMAQSASLQKTPVRIPFYWDKGIDPPLEWPNWAATLKIAIIAKEANNVDTLLRYKPEPRTYSTRLNPPTNPRVKMRLKHKRETGTNGV